DETPPQEVKDGLSESVYKASEQKDMPLFVFFDRIDAVNLPLGYIARGRYALYNGNIEEAKLQLNNAENNKPDMYEVPLLKAEIELKAGNQRIARDILTALSSDLGAPAWIRDFANQLLQTIP
ncbi:MAG TPA: hypothetical protein PLX90_09475, partial [Anaerolineales bacterium]|nr:hypothetical protein [Anaerolineales bacterium]